MLAGIVCCTQQRALGCLLEAIAAAKNIKVTLFEAV